MKKKKLQTLITDTACLPACIHLKKNKNMNTIFLGSLRVEINNKLTNEHASDRANDSGLSQNQINS